MSETTKRRRGKQALWSGDTFFIGLKCPISINEALLKAVKELKAMGFSDVDKSKLVRTILCYRIANATIIYKEANRAWVK